MSTAADRLLRALAEGDLDDGAPAQGDERLRAYQEGRLTPGETRELEGLLAHSAAGRRRLLELGGIDQSLPLRRVRKAVLAAAGPRRRLVPWISAAAVAASILLALFTFYPHPHGLPAGLAYDVATQGLAESRSAAPGEMASARTREVRAYPGTTVHILVRPRGESPAGVSLALFRREGDALRRVRQPQEVRLASDRGSATFEGTAASVLATEVPGVYVVAYAREEPPALLKLEPGQDPAGALRASGRLVYPVTVTLLRNDLPVEDGAR
jgi:hypothetical protein